MAIDYHKRFTELRAEYKATYDEETTDNWLLLKLQRVLDELEDNAERSTQFYENFETRYGILREKHREILKQIQQVSLCFKYSKKSVRPDMTS